MQKEIYIDKLMETLDRPVFNKTELMRRAGIHRVSYLHYRNSVNCNIPVQNLMNLFVQMDDLRNKITAFLSSGDETELMQLLTDNRIRFSVLFPEIKTILSNFKKGIYKLTDKHHKLLQERYNELNMSIDIPSNYQELLEGKARAIEYRTIRFLMDR